MRTRSTFPLLTVLVLAGCASRTVEPPPPSSSGSDPSPSSVARAPAPAPTPAPPAVVTGGDESRAVDPAEIEPTPTDPASLAALWEDARRARVEGRHDETLRLWEIVWEADPGYQDVAERLEEEYRVRGLDAFARGRPAEAVRLWEKALRIDPDDRKTQAYLSHAQAQATRLGEIPTGAPDRE